MGRLDLAIRYAPAYEDEALSLARRLFAQFDEAINSLVLVPTDDEDFSLSLNGQLLVSQTQSRRAPLVADVIKAMSSAQ